MNVAKLRSAAIRIVEEKNGDIILFFCFVLLFFFSTEQGWPRNFFYALMIPTFLISFRKTTARRLLSSNLWRLTLALLGYLLLTMLWGENPGKERPITFIRNALYLLVFFSLAMDLAIRRPRFPEKLFIVLAWTAAATALLSVLVFYHSAPFPSARLEYLADQLDNPVLGAILYGTTALIICFHFLRTSGGWQRWVYALFLVFISGSMLLTQSRGPVAVLLATLIIGGLITKDRKLLVVVGCIMVIGAAIVFTAKPYRQMVTQRGMSYRVELAKNTIAMIRNDLLFGRGLTTDQKVPIHDGRKLRHPHNVYLSTVLYGGLTGLAFLLLLMGTALREGWKHYRSTGNFTLPALVLFGAGTIIASQDKLIATVHPLWFFFWLPIALLAGVSRRYTESGRAGL